MFDVRPREDMLARQASKYVTLYNEAVALASSHHDAQALQLFKKVVVLDPNFPPAYYGYGTMLLKTGQPADALEQLTKFTELSPNAINGWEAMAACYQQMGNLQGVVTAYKNCVRIQPHGKRATELAKHIKFLEAQIADGAGSTTTANAPDYLEEIERVGLVRWQPDAMPLKVYIKSGSSVRNYRDDFAAFLKQAFADWAAVSEGHLSFTYVDAQSDAQIDCSWTDDPKELLFPGEAGHAAFTSNGHSMDHASILLLTTSRLDNKPVADDTARFTALHEVGHALGLLHSSNPKDVMFLAKGPAGALSSRDAKTIVALYTADKARIERKEVDLSRTIQPGADTSTAAQVAKLNSEAASLLQNNNYPAAEAKLKQALQLKPENELAHANLGVIYATQASAAVQLGEFPRAVELCKQAISSFENTRRKDMLLKALKQYGQLLTHLGKDEEAKEIQARASKLEPANQ